MSNEEQYKAAFDHGKAEKALEHALDIRKFEIGLYWQRAAYFWALIAAAFAGYFAILSAERLHDKEFLAYIIGCIGFLFTWAWFLVNRGSKYWQENWENHVDMLEDNVTGPLYKTVLHRPPQTDVLEKYITGPAAISVSKVNQWVSCFTLCIWATLVWHVLPPFDCSLPASKRHLAVGGVVLVFAALMVYRGKTDEGAHGLAMHKRTTRIR
jgi:hypothetical protein